MSRFDIKITAIDATHAATNKQTVSGTCDGKPFTAAPFNWGGRWLLKVHDDTRAQFGQGEKVAIGGACKKALKDAGFPCPETKSHSASANSDKPVVLINGAPITPVVGVTEPAAEEVEAQPEQNAEVAEETAEETSGEVCEGTVATTEDVPVDVVPEVELPDAEVGVTETEVVEETPAPEQKKSRRGK